MNCRLPSLIFAQAWLINIAYCRDVNQISTTNLKRDSYNDVFSANFIQEARRRLSASPILTARVEDSLECGQSCARNFLCFSFNLALAPNGEGGRLCELLSTDKFNSSNKLQMSDNFDHYSIKVGKYAWLYGGIFPSQKMSELEPASQKGFSKP